MKPLPTPDIPGSTPWERLDNAVRMVLAVPKEAFTKEEMRLKKVKARKKRAKERAKETALSR